MEFNMNKPVLYHVYDPMCSWCWAFRPVLLELKNKLPNNIEFIRLLGGLAADSNELMPEKTKQYVIDNWNRIQQQLPETKFNYDYRKCIVNFSKFSCYRFISRRDEIYFVKLA